jgi:citrate synthase
MAADLHASAALRQLGFVSTSTAAERLGVKPATLYAYVSRGLLEAHRATDSRESFFAPGDLRKLRERPRRVSSASPVTSAITLVRTDGVFYRGRSAVELAQSSRFEEVAALLWKAGPGEELVFAPLPGSVAAAVAAQRRLTPGALPLDRLATSLPAIADRDPFRHELAPAAVRRAAAALVATMVSSLPRADSRPDRPDAGVAHTLAGRLSAKPTSRLREGLDLALILVADHGLAASTLAARVAANTGAPVYSSVTAALSTLQGPRHGFASTWAEEMLEKVAAGREIATVVEEHLRRGETLWYPGYYDGGDPRATLLLEETIRLAPRSRTKTISKLLRFGDQHAMPPPGAEFSLAAFAHAFGLVRGGSQAVFAIGRAAGWVAHAMEEHASPSPLRMRATYVGPQPSDGLSPLGARGQRDT